MQNNREHIDDFLRDKMQDLQFEVNESHWADAERRLDEDKEKKRPFWFFFVAVVVLIGAGLAALTQYQGNNKTSNTVNNVALNTSTTPTANSNTENVNTTEPFTQTELASPETIDQNTTNVQNNQSNNSSANVNATNNQSNITANPTNDQGFTKKNTSNANQPASVAKTNNNTNQLISKTAKSLANNDNMTGSIPEGQNAASDIAVKNTMAPVVNKKASAAKKPNNTKKSTSNSLAASVVKNPAATNSNQSRMGDPVAVQSNEIQNPIQNPQAVKQQNIRVYKSPEDYQKLNPRYVASLANYEYTETVISLNQTKSDSIRAIAAKQNVTETKSEQKKKKQHDPKIFIQEPSSFFILAGLGSARGYMGNGTASPVWGLSPSLGAGYEQTFTDRMSVYLSVYMSYINHLNIRETATNVTYSFDRDSTLLSVTRKNLLQLHLPLQLSYKLTPKLSIAAGVGINLGLNSISIYEDSKQSTQDKQFGYMGGLRFMDVNANLGFNYAVSPRISLGVFYQQGFLDMTKNNYFNNQQSDINASGGILLRYKFIK